MAVRRIGTSVSEGDALALLAVVSVQAEDLNTPGSTVDEEVVVTAPAAGELADSDTSTKLGRPQSWENKLRVFVASYL